MVFSYGSSTILTFANEIRTAVNTYYGNASSDNGINVRQSMVLQDNALYGYWEDEYAFFNCYAYAIEEEENCDPGVFSWVSLGNAASTYYYNWYANINTIASWVESDLETLGHTVQAVQTTIPNVNLRYHNKLICVRKDEDGLLLGYDAEGNAVYFQDYHFMRMESSGVWTHKPGETHPLRYFYTPSNDRDWVSEGYDGVTGKYFRNENFTYDSDIYYIYYSTPCEWTYQQYNDTQHMKRCTICGRPVFENCTFEYTENGSGGINAECVECGRVHVEEE